VTEAAAYDYGELLVLQHDEAVGPSALARVLDARAHRRPWRLIDVPAGVPALDLDRVRGVIVLGGRMGVPDSADHPWMDEELDLLRELDARGVPMLGICLGAQLLARALSGQVVRREEPEFAFLPLDRTDEARDDPVFAGWPDGSAALLMHEDEVAELPPAATPMLNGPDGVPAWRAPGEGTYAVQFHPEVDAATVAGWLREEPLRSRCADAGTDPDVLLEEVERRERFHLAVGLSLVGRWVDTIVGEGDPDPTRGRRARSVSR
jgi:GMP synthase (glutamine-hydrolysing)